jgi:hypothetical protein
MMGPCNLDECEGHATLVKLRESTQDNVVKGIPQECRVCSYFIGFDMFRMIKEKKRRGEG